MLQGGPQIPKGGPQNLEKTLGKKPWEKQITNMPARTHGTLACICQGVRQGPSAFKKFLKTGCAAAVLANFQHPSPKTFEKLESKSCCASLLGSCCANGQTDWSEKLLRKPGGKCLQNSRTGWNQKMAVQTCWELAAKIGGQTKAKNGLCKPVGKGLRKFVDNLL